MEIFKDITPLRQYLWRHKLSNKTIGLVPTMGALHVGHASLIKASSKETDITVCSIFVNPIQFNNPSDLEKYPRDLERDIEFLKEAGCDVLFCPDADTMYPEVSQIDIAFGELATVMEGRYRKGHFNGVGIVVSKLLNIVEPHLAYFGQKDLQQFVIIDHLVKSLNFNVKLRCMPIIREEDGLAQSSRNERLSEEERKKAIIFYNALVAAKERIVSGMDFEVVKREVTDMFGNGQGAELEYFEIVNKESLKNIYKFDPNEKIALCIAGFVGEVRLIDNMLIE